MTDQSYHFADEKYMRTLIRTGTSINRFVKTR
jgi:hypothetical protein